MQPWKTLSRKRVLHYGHYLTVEEHAVGLPDGRVLQPWPWVITPDYINVAAITTEGLYVCFRQTKYGIAGTSLAPVGGYIESGEAPLATAQRELLEETGYTAPTWRALGHYCVDGNRGSGTAHLFLASGAHRITERNADDLEEQELHLLTRTEVEAALATGEFKVLAWATVMALALHYT